MNASYNMTATRNLIGALSRIFGEGKFDEYQPALRSVTSAPTTTILDAHSLIC
jgi:hypothetical protein